MKTDRRAVVALLGAATSARGALAKIRPALGTAEVHFRIATEPRLQIGTEVQIEIRRAVDQTAHQTEARVLSCDLSNDRAIYFFRLPSGVASVLGMLFNHREAVRVVPAPGDEGELEQAVQDAFAQAVTATDHHMDAMEIHRALEVSFDNRAPDL